MSSLFRIGAARLLSAPTLATPYAEWTDHGETRGRSVHQVVPSVLGGRIDRFGRGRIASAIHQAGTESRFRVPLVSAQVADLAGVIPGSVIYNETTLVALGLPTRPANQAPRAWCLAPVSDWEAGTWWLSENARWIFDGYAVIDADFVTEIPEGDDVFAQVAYEVTIEGFASPARAHGGSIGRPWLASYAAAGVLAAFADGHSAPGGYVHSAAAAVTAVGGGVVELDNADGFVSVHSALGALVDLGLDDDLVVVLTTRRNTAASSSSQSLALQLTPGYRRVVVVVTAVSVTVHAEQTAGTFASATVLTEFDGLFTTTGVNADAGAVLEGIVPTHLALQLL